jgi:sugar phosphate isomerase/epimerase
MTNNRRQVLKAGMACLASMTAAKWQPCGATGFVRHAGRPNSRINGVQIGVISYSFRSLADQSAEAVLRYCRELRIDAVELMDRPAEEFAGIQAPFDHERYWKVQLRSQPGQPPLSPAEQQEHDEVIAAFAAYRGQIAALRTAAVMGPFEQLRRHYEKSGVSIYAFRLDSFDEATTGVEINYGMRAARALGANQVSLELPASMPRVRRLAAAASRHGLTVAYHAHTQATPTLWDAALGESPANAIQLDIGHFVAADGYDPLPFIRQHHARIASMHLKDRQNRAHGQRELPWGQGDTPIAAALQLLRDQHYRFPAAIEFEYDTPTGSDAINEIGKCLDYCRQALAYQPANVSARVHGSA